MQAPVVQMVPHLCVNRFGLRNFSSSLSKASSHAVLSIDADAPFVVVPSQLRVSSRRLRRRKKTTRDKKWIICQEWQHDLMSPDVGGAPRLRVDHVRRSIDGPSLTCWNAAQIHAPTLRRQRNSIWPWMWRRQRRRIKLSYWDFLRYSAERFYGY